MSCNSSFARTRSSWSSVCWTPQSVSRKALAAGAGVVQDRRLAPCRLRANRPISRVSVSTSARSRRNDGTSGHGSHGGQSRVIGVLQTPQFQTSACLIFEPMLARIRMRIDELQATTIRHDRASDRRNAHLGGSSFDISLSAATASTAASRCWTRSAPKHLGRERHCYLGHDRHPCRRRALETSA